MIHIGSPDQEMHPRFLHAPGGFAWWYADLVAPGGDGLVMIWSYGLPFLPGYADADRRGRPQLPLARPSVNLAVYRGGKPAFYVLQEYRAAEAEMGSGAAGARPRALSRSEGRARSGGRPATLPAEAPANWGNSADGEAVADARLRIGSSTLVSRADDGRRRVEAALDLPIPGTSDRLTGTVRIDGVARRSALVHADPADTPHLWTPLTGPATGAAQLSIGGRPLASLEGRAYHDRNGGAVPLHALGMSHWAWGRLPFRDRERIYYLLWPRGEAAAPRCIGVEIDASGSERILDGLRVEPGPFRRSYLGLRWPRRVRLWDGATPWLDVTHAEVVDDGPFYLRYFSDATAADGEQARGIGEICYPDRVDLAAHRPFVRMRVHHASDKNSMWLPLFSGPRRDRVRRLLRQLRGGTG